MQVINACLAERLMMSAELMDAVAAAEKSALMAEAFSLYPQAYKAAERVREAANDGALAEALDGSLTWRLRCPARSRWWTTPTSAFTPNSWSRQAGLPGAASRYFAARSSCDVSMEPAFTQESPHIYKALNAVRTRAQEVMKDSGQCTAVRLFASIVPAGLCPAR